MFRLKYKKPSSGEIRISLQITSKPSIYEACPESKGTKVLNMYNIFNLQKRHCE